ncbi:MAG TPA: FtsX-like permease family protein [Methylomirabilota bacterium]|nr:FtsX-like permease family protein [Methylomirabilota bacterium]
MAAWVWRMAWRDSRGSRKRLLLAALAITCGLAALVAITSFGANVREAVRNQAKILLGADLVLSSRQPFGAETEAQIAAIGGAQAREVRANSMAYFPKAGGTRLVQVRALDGAFPYYGVLETEPVTAGDSFRTGPYALVDESLLYQFDAQVGDTIKLGAFSFTIVGRLKKIPGEAGAASLIGPRVYIPLAYLSHTGLIQAGSMVTYRVYFKLPDEVDPDRLLDTLRPHLHRYRLEGDTVKKRAASIGKIMENLSRFLNLTGFIALLLGGIGVASAIHVYITEKQSTTAILRCLGARTTHTFAVYITQAVALGLSGALFGALIGVSLQQALPVLLRDFLPVRIETAVSWSAVAESVVAGLGIVLLFALLPLLAIRYVSPLQALRSGAEQSAVAPRDPLRWLVIALTLFGVVSFALAHTERWTYGVGFCLAISGVLILLTAVAQALMRFTRAYVSPSWPYVWRQGFANLHRPHNQTHMLMLALGLGAFLLMTLQFVQQALIQQVSRTQEGNQANLILFDIQTDQREAIGQLVRSFSLPTSQEAPLVTMRLAAVKGKSVEALRNDPKREISDWALQHEYRATYRDHLIDTETLIAGQWQGQHGPTTETVTISLEEGVAEALQVKVGDELVFDVQGVPMATTIGSIRKVDWQQIKPNFFVVFPIGVLESAPQTYLLVTRTPSPEVSAAVQRAVVQQFPNVSAIDLTSVLHTLAMLLGKITFALRFMTLFSITAGLFVLVNAVLTSRSQRMRESVLLCTLGASQSQIQQILIAEYALLGGIAAISGALLAILASWALSRWWFETIYAPTVTPVLLALLIVAGITILTGVLGNRSAMTRPPLEVLREEG